MPRQKSGTPHWEPFAVRLPPPLLKQLRRQADLRHTNPAALIREGLEWRLNGTAEATDAGVSLPPTVLARLAETLTATAHQLLQVAQLIENMYDGNTETEVPAATPPPASRSSTYDGNT